MSLSQNVWDISWETLRHGQELPLIMGDPVTLNEIVRYQGASGDLHAAHHDAEAAARFGMERPFSLGLLSAGQMLAGLSDRLGAENVRHFKTRFRAVVTVGECLGWSGRVENFETAGRVRTAALRLTGALDDGRIAVDLWVTYKCSI